MKLTKYLCHVLTIKDVLGNRIHMLAYFHKDSATSCKEIEKDCYKKIVIKKIVIIEKNCDN